MDKLSYDAESQYFHLAGQEIRQGDTVDILIHDTWVRARIHYHQQFNSWVAVAKQVTTPDNWDESVVILLQSGLTVKLGPGRWSMHF